MDIVYVQDAQTPVAGFADLYEAHAKDVWRYALALSGNAAAADDLTAESFLRIWQAGERVRLTTVKSYLLAIVRNLYRSQWRQARRQDAMPEHLQAWVADPAVAIELAETLNLLQQLAETERSALLLRAEHGLSYAEIAELLGISEGAARSQVFRARGRLKELRSMPCQKR